MFEARIEPLEWGRNSDAILRLPAEVVEALGRPRRVEREIADHPIDAGLARADVIADAFLYVGERFLADAGIEPGALVEARLRASDAGSVEVSEDVAAAIRAVGRTHAWEALTSGRRRELLHPVAAARRAGTRDRRITALVALLG